MPTRIAENLIRELREHTRDFSDGELETLRVLFVAELQRRLSEEDLSSESVANIDSSLIPGEGKITGLFEHTFGELDEDALRLIKQKIRCALL